MGNWEWKVVLVGRVLLCSHHGAASKGSREAGTGVLGKERGLWGGSGSRSALTMEPALHTSRVTALRCCFSRVMAG